MFWIGLTGGLGSGKSTVTTYLRSLGIVVVDADELAKEALLPQGRGFDSVVKEFGEGILSSEGLVDRAQLAKLVFKDTEKLNRLEKIIHPLVQSRVLEMRKEAEGAGTFWAFYDVPLLYEKNLESQFDAVVVVSVDEKNQRERIKKRNGWSDPEIDLRLGAQIPLLKKVTRTPFVIENNGTRAELEKSVDVILKKLKDQLCIGKI